MNDSALLVGGLLLPAFVLACPRLSSPLLSIAVLSMRFRPCIDLRAGKVTQIVGSTLTATASTDVAVENFISSRPSSHYARLYEAAGLSGGHVIMLGAGNDAAALEALQAWKGGMQLGGGITDMNAQYWLDAGASHVILTSWLFDGGSLDTARLARLCGLVGRQRLVVDLSCRRRPDDPAGPYYVVTNRWQTFSSLQVNTATLHSLSQYCSEFLIHGVDVEGRRCGVEQSLIRLIKQAIDAAGGDELHVVYAGGVRDMADVRLVDELGGGRIDVSVGSALDIFGGDLSFDEVVAYCKEKRHRVS